MTPLRSELQRLYLPHVQAESAPDALIDPLDRVRALVLSLSGPPSWEVLGAVWQGVQADLELPAPGIAVSGIDALELWFSLEAPIAVAQAHAFLEGLRSRYLSHIKPARVSLSPTSDASALRQDQHARLVPAHQDGTGNWSAFLAPDLAPVFADTPWLDVAPNEEGQASLLRGLAVTRQAAFEAAWERLMPAAPPAAALATLPPASAAAALTSVEDDPRRFLARVMNDETAPLALRIEAAKALLQDANAQRRSD